MDLIPEASIRHGSDEDLALPENIQIAANNPETLKAKKVVEEFVHMLEKSKTLFNGLKEIPNHEAKLWQPYFSKTFEIYTKLWKFQQDNRPVLEKYYNLQRWQIGEIASKIGQIYYFYYLRTSEANYLYESYSFYAAIRTRSYYAKAKKLASSEVMLKKLRYYTRFITVCLLLRRMSLVIDLVKELHKQIKDYRATYNQTERDWILVANEVALFCDNEQLVRVKDQFGRVMYLSSRLTPDTIIQLDRGIPVYLETKEIIIVSNHHDQVKFSELTLDMFRILQTFEHEPDENILKTQQNEASMILSMPKPAKPEINKKSETTTQIRRNPRKYLLYKPTYSQFNSYLCHAFKSLPPQSALVLYFSCEPSYANNKKEPDESSSLFDVCQPLFDCGGIGLNCSSKDEGGPRKKTGGHDMHCIHPGDIVPYTRKPLFLIIDSHTANAFKNIPKLFGQPLVALMAAPDVPAALSDLQHQGSLLTLFLFNPTMAFFYVCNIDEVPEDLWVKCEKVVYNYLEECSKLFVKCRKLNHDYMQFYGDDFLRMVLLRFCFCCTVLNLHRAFKGPNYYPTSYPEISASDIYLDPTLQSYVSELSSLLDTTVLFVESVK